MPSLQRVVHLPHNPGKVDDLEFAVADNGRLEELLKKGWHIVQITAGGDRGGVYALIERQGPPARGTIPVGAPE